MSKPNILVVEDDPDIQQLVTYNLIKAGMHVVCADNGEDALDIIGREQVDAVVLDLMLPNMDGLETCRAIRSLESAAALPIIMLTAKSEENDILAGLKTGADDYVTKPFSPKILTARVQALLRRTSDAKQQSGSNEEISVHGLTIHSGRHEVIMNGAALPLTTTEFTILQYLASKTGWVFTRQQIIDHVRGSHYLITPRAVDVQIFGLRKKLGDKGHLIETVRGIGYRMKE